MNTRSPAVLKSTALYAAYPAYTAHTAYTAYTGIFCISICSHLKLVCTLCSALSNGYFLLGNLVSVSLGSAIPGLSEVITALTTWKYKKPLSKSWAQKRAIGVGVPACGGLCRIAHKNTFNLATFK